MEEHLPESAFSMRFGRLIMKYRFATLMTLVSLSLFFAFPLVNAAWFNFTASRSPTGEGRLLFGVPARFRMDANVRKTFPEHPYIHAQDKFAGKFGSPSAIAIAVVRKNGEIYDYDFLEKVSRITDKLDQAPNVNHYQVRSLTHINTRVMTIQPDGAIEATPLIDDVPDDPKLLAALKDKVLENPGPIYGQLVSRDHRACFISAGFITKNLDNREAYTELFNYLRNLKTEEEADGTAEIYISGAPMATGYVIDSQFQIVYYLLVTIVALFFLLLAYFRRLHGVAIPMVAGLATSIWGMGFCAWVGITLDPLVLVIPLLITARSISHTIQMAERFFEDYEMECNAAERRLGRALTREELDDAKVETATTAMAKLMLPGMLGILADAAGLAVCFLTTIQTMRDLSIFGSFWVVAIIFNVIMLHPIMISYLPPPHDFHHFTPAWMQRFLAATGRLATGPTSKWVLTGGTAFGLALATWYVLYHTTIGESRPGSPVFWPDHPYNVATGKIGETFGGVDQFTVFVDGDGKSASSDGLVLQRMEAMQRYMRSHMAVGQTISLVDVIKQYWLVNHYNDPKWGFVPDSAQTIGGIIFQLQQNSTPGFLRPYLTDDAEDANITFLFPDHKGQTIKRAVHYAEEFIEANPMGRINVRLDPDRGQPLDAAYYLVGPVLFPRHAAMKVQVADINDDQRITGYREKKPTPVGRWSEPARADEVLTRVVAALQSQSRQKLGTVGASDRFKEDLSLDAEHMERVADKLSADDDYRIETVDHSAAEVIAGFATVGELVRYIVDRSKFYVVEEWKNDEGNITAQTLRYCRTYCGYELWTQNTKFKDTSFNPQRTNTYTRGAEFVLAGGIMGVYAAVNEEVERGHVANILLIFLICYLFVAVSYRSNIAGLVIVFSLATATIGSLAWMAWRETGLTIQTLPVQSVGVGVGVDYAFYTTDRIRQEYSWLGDLDEAIRRAICTTGMAVSFTATTVIGGIVAWAFSGLRFQAEMAQLLSILMFVNMLGAIYLVPACFSIFRPRFFAASLSEATQQHHLGDSAPAPAVARAGL
ncbi:MAG TPA: MMPL family transporter [Myxococcota bacterium]|nr:MMPL family transporter [Myxococcota bacterium]